MKKFAAIFILFLLSNLIYCQNYDTLSFYKEAFDIIKLYKNENSDKLLEIYKKTEGPKFITLEQIKKIISYYETSNINLNQLNFDSTKFNTRLEKLTDQSYIKEFKFEFKIPSNKMKNNFYRIVISFSIYYKNEKFKSRKYNLYYIEFYNN